VTGLVHPYVAAKAAPALAVLTQVLFETERQGFVTLSATFAPVVANR
jgi:hypothetical protein